MSRTALLERIAVIAAIVYVITSIFFPPVVVAGPPATVHFTGSGFLPNAVYSATDHTAVPNDVALVGSYIGGDTSTGAMQTAWQPITASIAFVFVAGYPNKPMMSLRMEERCGTAIHARAVTPLNPGEKWIEVEVPIASCSANNGAVRIVADDRSTSFQGWLGTSDLLLTAPSNGFGPAMIQVVRLAGCTLLAFVLVFFPGLALARRFRLFAAAPFVALPGLALLFLTGASAWPLFKQGAGAGYCSTIVLLILFMLLWAMVSVGKPLLAAISYRRLFAVVACVILIVTGKQLYSPGPGHELYGGTISRTFEPGDRSDSRISYHVVQLVANGATAYGELAHLFLSPWTFSDRGPIAGLAATPIVLATGATPPAVMPDQVWQPFDPQGFAAYRAAMFVFASTVLFGLFGLVAEVAGARAARFSVAVAALAPFVVHETWFTWPKIFATAVVLGGAYCCARRRYAATGIFVGVAYLIHPGALFALPALFAFAASREWPVRRRIATAVGIVLAGPIAFMILWRVANGSHYSQTGFLNYVFDDDGAGSGIVPWTGDRLRSLANTLVPFWLPIVNGSSREINAIGGVDSSMLDHFDFAYWCSLPFALGLFYVVPFTRLAIAVFRRRPLAFSGIVAAPFVIFWLYWGSASSGLMREGLHAWLFTLIAFVIAIGYREALVTERVHSLWIRLRAIEIAALALVPTIFDSGHVISSIWPWSDVLALFSIAGGCIALALVVLPLGRPIE